MMMMMMMIDGRLDRDSWMIRPPLLQWATEYSHFIIRQVILTMAKSSELTSHRPQNHLIQNRYENGPWKVLIEDSSKRTILQSNTTLYQWQVDNEINLRYQVNVMLNGIPF